MIILPEATLKEWMPHTVFYEGQRTILNCSGPRCQVCRGVAAVVNWKTIGSLIKKLFGDVGA